MNLYRFVVTNGQPSREAQPSLAALTVCALDRRQAQAILTTKIAANTPIVSVNIHLENGWKVIQGENVDAQTLTAHPCHESSLPWQGDARRSQA